LYFLVKSGPSATGDLPIKFEPGESEIIRAGAILAGLQDSEVAESIVANLSVEVFVNCPGGDSSFLFKHLLLFFKVRVFVSSASHVYSLVKANPINLVVRSLKLPVHQAVSSGVPVADGVNGWNQSTVFAKVNSEVRVRFVVCAAVGQSSAHKVFDLSSADR
jgi:hypothetical protein